MDSSFDELIDLALAQELVGWDFSWLNARTSEDPLPWDYEAIVHERVNLAQAVLDIDTGGGELLSRLGPFPMVTWATEGYPPNLPLARARLEPLGIQVADVSVIQGLLPFVDNTFDLVINRHGSLYADEVERVLQPGGRLITQQVGGENCMDLNRALQDEPEYVHSGETLDHMVDQLKTARMLVETAREVFPKLTFHDIAGVVFYLKAIPWQIADFSVQKYRPGLARIHAAIQQEGGFTVREHRILIEAKKV